MEYCNGSDLKDVMELRHYDVRPATIQKIMQQLVSGFNDMLDVLVIHRDLKLQNIMIHFPNMSEQLLGMTKDVKKLFFKETDLDKIDFEIKIADFGFSKKLKTKN